MTDGYADAGPEEFVTVVGVGPMTLRTAVRGYVAAREKAAGTAGVLLTMVAREPARIPRHSIRPTSTGWPRRSSSDDSA